MNLSLYTTRAIIALDANGKRLFAKYYKHSTQTSIKEQLAFENSLFEKTKKAQNAEIILFDNNLVVYRFNVDVFLYLVGHPDENELMLWKFLSSYYESLMLLLSQQFEKKTILEHLDVVFLALDECIDDGIVLEIEPEDIVQRVTKKSADIELPIAEQSFTQAFQRAKEQLTTSLLK